VTGSADDASISNIVDGARKCGVILEPCASRGVVLVATSPVIRQRQGLGSGSGETSAAGKLIIVDMEADEVDEDEDDDEDEGEE
jgi:hypothetical protein